MITSISKVLTSNDLGLTGTHQAGIHIPKQQDFLDFFPALNPEAENPRASFSCRDQASGRTIRFNFIYYNNRRRCGTRDEYRLTGMTIYLRTCNASEGDVLVFEKTNSGSVDIRCDRPTAEIGHKSPEPDTDNNRIVLSGSWKIIKTR